MGSELAGLTFYRVFPVQRVPSGENIGTGAQFVSALQENTAGGLEISDLRRVTGYMQKNKQKNIVVESTILIFLLKSKLQCNSVKILHEEFPKSTFLQKL